MNRAPRFIPTNTRLEGRCSRAFGLGTVFERLQTFYRSALEKLTNTRSKFLFSILIIIIVVAIAAQPPGESIDYECVGSSVFGTHCHDEPSAPYGLNIGPPVGFCQTCSSVTGLLPSMNTAPLSRSGAKITKAAAAASNIPPAIDHMTARFMALSPSRWRRALSKEPQ
jgi:hypothetical protein